MTLTISAVAPDRRALALRLLFAQFPLEEQPTRLDEAMRSAERGSLNLEALLLAEDDGLPVGATLMMPQADGVALVWPPVVSCQSSDVAAVEHALMTRLCEEIDGIGSKLAQCLLAPDNVVETTLLQRYGFSHAADMFFLARALTPADIESKPTDSIVDGGLEHDTFSDTSADRYASVIERTYAGSLDCPFLNDFRTGHDALTSHRLSGQYNPAGWRLYRQGNEDVGLVLMNEHVDQDAIELVYFGIVPEYRGRGLGRRVLSEAIQSAAEASRSVLFLAVDCGNTYANALYSELGFAELARRRVMLRRSTQTARE